jgi:hypothetical protein
VARVAVNPVDDPVASGNLFTEVVRRTHRGGPGDDNHVASVSREVQVVSVTPTIGPDQHAPEGAQHRCQHRADCISHQSRWRLTGREELVARDDHLHPGLTPHHEGIVARRGDQSEECGSDQIAGTGDDVVGPGFLPATSNV